MKKRMTLLTSVILFIFMSSVSFGQNAPIDFESNGFGADWTWTVFENGDNPPPVEIIPNPDVSGINTSATVAKITALQIGNPWVGCESKHGSDIGSFSFDETNKTVKIMVWKSVISDVGLKFAEANSDAQPEVKVANTLINQWEELTFDLSGSIGAGATGVIDQIIIFPDFNARAGDNIVYFDNITFSGENVSTAEPTSAAPLPIHDEMNDNVFSIFSDSFTNLAGTNFNPNWSQATSVSTVEISGNQTLLYTGLNYQGTNLGSADATDQDLTGYTHLHVDFWTANSTTLNFFLISRGSGEHPYSLPIESENWVSVDIPLSYYSDLGLSLNDIFQFKVEGDGDVYFDNWYFYSVVTSVEEDLSSLPSSYSLEQNYPNPFNPTTNIKFGLVESGFVTLKIMNVLGEEVVTLINGFRNAGTYEVSFDASSLSSGTYFYSISSDNFNAVKKMLLIK